jgi:hypothetical protein
VYLSLEGDLLENKFYLPLSYPFPQLTFEVFIELFDGNSALFPRSKGVPLRGADIAAK